MTDWDEAAVRSRHGHVLQSRAWAEIRARQGWRPEELRVGDPLPLALILWRDLPAGLRFAYAPRGPVFDHERPEQLEAVLAALARRAREERAMFLKVDAEIPREGADLVAAYARHGFRRSGQEVQPITATIQIDLGRGEDELLSGMDKDTRWSVRTAERRGVRVEERSDPEALRALQVLYSATGERAGFITRPDWYYERVWSTLLEAGHASLYLALAEERAVAGAMIYWCGERAVYWYGASDEAARQTYAAFALQWHCIRAAKARGAKTYDLGGIPDPPSEGHPWWGIYLFKKGFGGEARYFAGAHDAVPRPLLYRGWLLAEPRAYAAAAALGRLRRRLG